MIDFFKGQMDYIYFFYGLAFFMVSGGGFIMARRKDERLPWLWFALFAITHTVHEWLDFVKINFGDSPALQFVAVLFGLVSFLFLLEFGRSGLAGLRGKGIGRWVFIPLLIIIAVGGPGGLETSWPVVGLIGGLWAGYALILASKEMKGSPRHWLFTLGATVWIYALAAAFGPRAGSFPASHVNGEVFLHAFGFPVQLLRGALAMLAATSLWAYSQSAPGEVIPFNIPRYRHFFRPIPVLLIIILLGWGLTQLAGNHAEKEETREGDLFIGTLANNIDHILRDVRRAAKTGAGSPAMVTALDTGRPADVKEASSVLGQCSNVMSSASSACYLFDAGGKPVMSSSDKLRPDIISSGNGGINKKILSADQGYYFFDTRTREWNFIVRYPIRNGKGKTIGILAAMENLTELEEVFRRHPHCFLVDPDGIVFLSSNKKMRLKTLWPSKEKERRGLAQTGLFESRPFTPLLSGEAVDGKYVSLNGRRLLVSRNFMGDGWSLILLNTTGHVKAYRLFAIFTTLAFFILTVIFFAAFYFFRETTARIALSERRYRSLVEGSPNCVILFDREGRCLTVNKAGLESIGCSRSDVAGSRLDRFWTGETSRAFDSAIEDARRGNRHFFEVSSLCPADGESGKVKIWNAVINPIIDLSGDIRNFVGIFTDVTDRKKAEMELRRAHDELEEKVRERTSELLDANERLQGEMGERLKAEEALATALRRAEEERAKSDAIMAALGDGISMQDREFRVLYQNQVHKDLLGECTGQYCYKAYAESSFLCLGCPVALSFNDGDVHTLEKAVRRGEETAYIEIKASPLKDRSGKVIAGIELVRDVTERKRAEELVRESEDRYKNLVELTTDVIYISDREGNQAFMNDAAYKVLGYTPEEVIGKPWTMLVHPDDREKSFRKFLDMIEQGFDVFNFENRQVTKNGKILNMLHNMRILRNERGEVVGAQGIARDITERKQAEEKLRLFSEAIEEAMDGVQIVDLNGRIIYSNRAVGEIYGFSAAELIGTRVGDLNVEKDFDRTVILPSIRETGRWNGELTVLHKNGKEFPIWLSTSAVKNSLGTPIALIGITRDITERKKVEEELKKHREHLMDMVEERTSELKTAVQLLTQEIAFRKTAEETLREGETRYRNLSQEFHTLLDAIPDTLLLLSSDLEVMWANEGAAKAFGKKVSELTGLHCYNIWHNSAVACDNCHAMKSFLTGSPESSKRTAVGNRLLDSRAFPIKGDDGGVNNVILIVTDITEKATLEAEAMRASHLASIGELAAGVAHEINNPINGIINYAQMLANRSTQRTKEAEIAGRIMKEGDRIAGIVRSLLSFARERKEEKAPSSLQVILFEALTLSEAQFRKDGIELRMDFPAELPDVIANPQQVQQVFLNVISNARYALNQKYPGADKSKLLEISGENTRVDDLQYVRFTFCDYGTGIPANILDKVMNPFFSTKPSGQGTGLGLSISHGLIKDHGGRLTIESTEGEYSRIMIDLPVRGTGGKET